MLKQPVSDLGADTATKAVITANNLIVNKADSVKDTDQLSLKSGSFTVVNGLEGGTSAGFAIDSKAALNLGNLKQDAKGAWSTDNTEGGAVDSALEVKGDGALNVQAGSWNLAGLKVSAGMLPLVTKGSQGQGRQGPGCFPEDLLNGACRRHHHRLCQR